jgi:hypothetical protein
MAHRSTARLADLIETTHDFLIGEFKRAPDPETKLRVTHAFVDMGRRRAFS